MLRNNWHVITGGPSTGKTTLLAELQKLGYKTVPEAARTLIDEAIAEGKTVEELRADERHFQEDIARLKETIEANLDRDVLTFFDRGMHDTLAYMRHYDYNAEAWIEKLMQQSTYRKVFLLEPLPTYQADYARTEKPDFTKKLHQLLIDAYAEYGMEPIIVPVMSPKKRAQFVLDHVDLEQVS